MSPEPSIFDEADQAAIDAADAEGEDDLEAGRMISWAAVKRWLLSWGTNNKLPPPNVGD